MRLFVGIPIPNEVREHLRNGVEGILYLPARCRLVDPAQWHFTLAFLGDVADDRLAALALLLKKAIERPPQGAFRFTDFRTFPPRRAAYLVANAIVDPAQEWIAYIERLRDMISVAAPHVDRKPWVPHVTIGRAKRGETLAPWRHEIRPLFWRPTSFALIKSISAHTGSTYSIIHDYPIDI